MGFVAPPKHDLERGGKFIARTDPAWDFDRIARERQEMIEEGKDPDEHPVVRYFTGQTRFVLEEVRQYVDMASAWIFTLRRIPIDERKDLEDLLYGGSDDSRRWKKWLFQCAKQGVKSVKNAGDFEIELIGKHVSGPCLERLASIGAGLGADGAHHRALDEQIGAAAWAYSQPLTDAEKKLSA